MSYVLLAKKAVEEYIMYNNVISHQNIYENYIHDKGVFITINKNNKLRGCMGTYYPTKETIEDEIINNAILAATSDNRFKKINIDELNKLTYSVTLINEPKIVNDKIELNPKKYGILVASNLGKTGILLPNLDGVDTIDKQLDIVLKKASINLNNEETKLHKFTVEKYK